MIAVGLACLSAILFGALSVALRYALRRSPDAELGALVTVGAALAICALAAVGDLANEGGARWHDIPPFLLAGMLGPGITQILFLRAIRDAGPARASVLVGTAPLMSVVLAIALLGEPVRAGIVVGAVAIVLGGAALAVEKERPEHFRLIGAAAALAGAAGFATRDTFVRWRFTQTHAPPLIAATATVVGGAAVISLYLLVSRPPVELGRRGLVPAVRPFLPAGALFGISYVALFEAYARGRVTVVSPLVATEALWGVLFAAAFLRVHELIGRRLVLGALLIVGGGALIGVFR